MTKIFSWNFHEKFAEMSENLKKTVYFQDKNPYNLKKIRTIRTFWPPCKLRKKVENISHNLNTWRRNYRTLNKKIKLFAQIQIFLYISYSGPNCWTKLKHSLRKLIDILGATWRLYKIKSFIFIKINLFFETFLFFSI